MTRAWGTIPRYAATVARTFRARLRAGGWACAHAYAKWLLLYTYTKCRNRLHRRARVTCPCCGWQGWDFQVLDCGTFTVPSVECPHCRAHERHRMLHLYLDREHPDFFSIEGHVLHFAPEQQVQSLILRNPKLRTTATDYALYMVQRFPGPAFHGDIQQLGVKDDAFDVVFCLHVLEHVPDDRKGIAELHRIVRPDGVVYIMVPFMMGWPRTVEFGKPDPAIFDHVRGYSPNDFKERLASFEYQEILPATFLSEDEVRRHRIPDSQAIYRCTKKPRLTS